MVVRQVPDILGLCSQHECKTPRTLSENIKATSKLWASEGCHEANLKH